MEEKLISYKRARLSFGSFIVFMAIAGFIIALVPTLLDTLFSIWWLIAGDPSITISKLAKPYLSLLITPLEVIISGIIIYPLYTRVLKRYAQIGIKLYSMD